MNFEVELPPTLAAIKDESGIEAARAEAENLRLRLLSAAEAVAAAEVELAAALEDRTAAVVAVAADPGRAPEGQAAVERVAAAERALGFARDVQQRVDASYQTAAARIRPAHGQAMRPAAIAAAQIRAAAARRHAELKAEIDRVERVFATGAALMLATQRAGLEIWPPSRGTGTPTGARLFAHALRPDKIEPGLERKWFGDLTEGAPVAPEVAKFLAENGIDGGKA